MNPAGQVAKRRMGQQAQARMMILALVFFLMGVGVGAWWFSHKPSGKGASQTDWNHAPARSANVSPEPPTAPPADLAALDAVQHFIPDVNSTSLQEGTRILREAALAELWQTAQELQARQKKAEQNFIQGQNNPSDVRQKIATKQLQELQAEQVEKLKQIAAKSKARIETLQRLKEAAR